MRTYYRCVDCLEIAVLESDGPAYRGNRSGALCDCGGLLETMGRVESDNRLKSDTIRCKCDRRCTFARGPSCDCLCQGKNHGAGMLAEVEAVIDHGNAPRLKARCSLPERLARVAAFKAAVESARKAGGTAFDAYRRGQYVAERSAWLKARAIDTAIGKAVKARCHVTRMRLLAEFVPATRPVVMRPMVAVEQPATVQGGLFA